MGVFACPQYDGPPWSRLAAKDEAESLRRNEAAGAERQ
jgi:hypothetical protein